jgi:hypothetical protein
MLKFFKNHYSSMLMIVGAVILMGSGLAPLALMASMTAGYMFATEQEWTKMEKKTNDLLRKVR